MTTTRSELIYCRLTTHSFLYSRLASSLPLSCLPESRFILRVQDFFFRQENFEEGVIQCELEDESSFESLLFYSGKSQLVDEDFKIPFALQDPTQVRVASYHYIKKQKRTNISYNFLYFSVQKFQIGPILLNRNIFVTVYLVDHNQPDRWKPIEHFLGVIARTRFEFTSVWSFPDSSPSLPSAGSEAAVDSSSRVFPLSAPIVLPPAQPSQYDNGHYFRSHASDCLTREGCEDRQARPMPMPMPMHCLEQLEMLSRIRLRGLFCLDDQDRIATADEKGSEDIDNGDSDDGDDGDGGRCEADTEGAFGLADSYVSGGLSDSSLVTVTPYKKYKT